MKNNRRIWRLAAIALIVGLSCSLAGCGLFPTEEEALAPPLTTPKDIQYQTAEVVRETVEYVIPVSATFNTNKTRRLAYEFDGRFEEWAVMLGDSVEEGTVIARLNLGDLTFRIEQAAIALKQAEASVESSRIALQQAKRQVGEAQEDLDKAIVRTSEAQATHAIDMAEFARQKVTRPRDDTLATQAAYDKVLAAEKAAERALQVARDELELSVTTYERAHKAYLDLAYATEKELEAAQRLELDAKTKMEQNAWKRDDAIAEHKNALKNTQLALAEYTETMSRIQDGTYYNWAAEESAINAKLRAVQDAQDAAARRVTSANDAVKAAEEGLVRAELAMESAQNTKNQLEVEYDKSALKSPMKGVVSNLDAKLMKGDTVRAFSPIAVIIDPFSLQIEVAPGALNNAPVTVGMEGELTYEGKKYKCELVSTPADLLSSEGLTEDEKAEFKSYVFQCDENIGGKQGDTAQINIFIDKHENVLVVPRQAVRNSAGRTYVLIMDENGKRIEANVDVGLQVGTVWEIIRGVEEGQLVVLP